MEMIAEQDNSARNSFRNYLEEINRYKLLTAQEERSLARQLKRGDTDAGHRLVTSNLRFVVKIAREYRSYGIALPDLIQEGNLGLMKAVQKFDPRKKIRLISYAVWWIRAYIQNYILRSWSLIKLGTTQAQRKLFYSLARTRRQLEKIDGVPVSDVDRIARMLRVRPKEVEEMQQRLNGRDVSLDAPLGGDGESDGTTLSSLLVSPAEPQDDTYARKEQTAMASNRVHSALASLDPRERYIIEQRVMIDSPVTLKRLGEHFGFSRERARQIEIRAKKKLRKDLSLLGGWAEAA